MKGNVTPVFKKERKEDLGNHTLVSFTSVPGKIVEQILMEVILRHVPQGGVWSQPAWLSSGKLCLNNLVALYDGVTATVNEGRQTSVIYLEFSKPFDMVPYNTLISRVVHTWT